MWVGFAALLLFIIYCITFTEENELRPVRGIRAAVQQRSVQLCCGALSFCRCLPDPVRS